MEFRHNDAVVISVKVQGLGKTIIAELVLSGTQINDSKIDMAAESVRELMHKLESETKNDALNRS